MAENSNNLAAKVKELEKEKEDINEKHKYLTAKYEDAKRKNRNLVEYMRHLRMNNSDLRTEQIEKEKSNAKLFRKTDALFATLDMSKLLVSAVSKHAALFFSGKGECRMVFCKNLEEFSLSCGHNYCFSCLADFLLNDTVSVFNDESFPDGENGNKNTYSVCPECRSIITDINVVP